MIAWNAWSSITCWVVSNPLSFIYIYINILKYIYIYIYIYIYNIYIYICIYIKWTHGKEHLQTFLQELNNFNPDLKFTYEPIEKEIPFLDIKVKLNEGKISTDLYIKSTDRHQYLHFTSSHPNHTKRSIVYSQGLRVKRICSENEDFLRHIREMKLWFLKRGYPENIVDQELGKVDFSESSRRTNKWDKGVCLVATYHPLLQNIGRIFHRHLDLLYTDQEVERVFTPGPMASFRSAKKIRRYLVRAKLYPFERQVGSFKCGGRCCQVCLMYRKQKHLLVLLLIRPIKLIMSLIVTKVLLFTYQRVSSVKSSMSDKL